MLIWESLTIEIMMKNRKQINTILLLILIISIGSILLINGQPELTENWTVNTKSIVKQYCKVIGFLSVMALVYLRLKSSKLKSIDEDEVDEVDSIENKD